VGGAAWLWLGELARPWRRSRPWPRGRSAARGKRRRTEEGRVARCPLEVAQTVRLEGPGRQGASGRTDTPRPPHRHRTRSPPPRVPERPGLRGWDAARLGGGGRAGWVGGRHTPVFAARPGPPWGDGRHLTHRRKGLPRPEWRLRGPYTDDLRSCCCGSCGVSRQWRRDAWQRLGWRDPTRTRGLPPNFSPRRDRPRAAVLSQKLLERS
jgi:hypothetical protein